MLVITDFVTHMQVSSLLYNFISIQFSNQSVITTLVSHQKFVTKKFFGGTKFPTLIGSTTPQLLTGDQAVQFPIRSPQSPTLPLALISPPSVPKLAPFVSHLPDHLWPQAPSHSKSTVIDHLPALFLWIWHWYLQSSHFQFLQVHCASTTWPQRSSRYAISLLWSWFQLFAVTQSFSIIPYLQFCASNRVAEPFIPKQSI